MIEADFGTIRYQSLDFKCALCLHIGDWTRMRTIEWARARPFYGVVHKCGLIRSGSESAYVCTYIHCKWLCIWLVATYTAYTLYEIYRVRNYVRYDATYVFKLFRKTKINKTHNDERWVFLLHPWLLLICYTPLVRSVCSSSNIAMTSLLFAVASSVFFSCSLATLRIHTT